MRHDTEQASVFAALRDPAFWPGSPDRVDVIETHAAVVFMARETALKVKRAVRLSYLDFTALEARRRVIERELEVNKPAAPELYVDTVAITREPDGRLAIGGGGHAVEWALRMRRFPQEDLLSHHADARGIDGHLVRALSAMVVACHRRADTRTGAPDPVPGIARSVLGSLNAAADPRVRSAMAGLEPSVRAALEASHAVRARRTKGGYIRRCHGDLHLGNIVLWKGQPLPFDAIEFDEGLATIDTLYDLAFLLMDLERRGQRQAANLVLERYLWETGGLLDLDGLAALPLFLGLRALIRAMVALDRLSVGATNGPDPIAHVLETLALAGRLLSPPAPKLLAIGGLSGTGKSTLAAALAPTFGAAPGALHLRTDLERKWLAGVGEFDRLPDAAYTSEAARLVYDRVSERARHALRAGHSVIVDGVFARSDERCAMARLARESGAGFHGLWLAAVPETLRARVEARQGDASDATAAVVDRQLSRDLGPIGWDQIASDGPIEDVRERASRAIAST